MLADGERRRAVDKGNPVTIAVLDYGMGNLRSVERALAHVGGDAEITDDPSTVADGISLDPITGNYELTFDTRVDWSRILRAVQPAQSSCPSSDAPISQDSSG